ncbi:peptidase inhibitor family I36 protein [Actinomadura atramentaria]|uniref:peptidase inhibitor family I36 protein n=1 Tax=Actinomadura atramentaria TaxID=1990 RepID=UPI0003AAFC48|nr:peptidase inhibitor family I36 protein [Actinomadura atramentaria]
MSRMLRTAAVAGVGAALALGAAGTARAAEPATGPKLQAKAATCYVWAYQLKNFGGQRACLTGNIKNLAGYTWPNGASADNSFSSLTVDKACQVQLFQYKNYTGAVSTWKRTAHLPGAVRKDTTLSNNKVGDNRTSSVKVYCAADV